MYTQTIVYKTVESSSILADLYWEESAKPLPILIYLHGGALMMGSRKLINQDQLLKYLAAGYMVIALDFRLIPETKLPDIIEDVKDAFQWIRKNASQYAPVNLNKIAVIGHSGGAYLALLSGYLITPRPCAIVSFYGYGDVFWKCIPEADKNKQLLPFLSKEETIKSIGTPNISENFDLGTRLPFYLHCRATGEWPIALLGIDPKLHPEKFVRYCPIKNIDAQYPPTFLLHGDRDTVVPYTQSQQMANELQKAKITSRFQLVPNADHAFDMNGLKDNTIEKYFSDVIEFLDQYCK
ncbi:MAG: hypothetical protein RBG13Loki_0029 [Promethearchaeota archaeon CR_4]|nr:MAG: hypothetical protein RBG13Loki_0029 [Candidatus Lokiarchaeota archaeon CR_4]